MTHVYDKAKFHSGGKWPEGLPHAHAFHHTGFFLGWLVERDLVSTSFRKESAAEIGRFLARELTAPRLFEACDGVLDDDMLSNEGNHFARAYFEIGTGAFTKEYDELLADGLDSIYHVADTWENYDALKQHLDRRLAEWRSRTPEAVRTAKPQTPQREFLQRLEERLRPQGWKWLRSTQKLFRGPKEPRTYVHLILNVSDGCLSGYIHAWIGFRDVAVVMDRAWGRSLDEARERAKDPATIERNLGGWDSKLPDASDVLDDVTARIAGPATAFHDSCRTIEDAAKLYDEAMSADSPSVSIGTHFETCAHLSILWLLRDRTRFEAAATAWSARGENWRKPTEAAATFLREKWDARLLEE